VYALRLSMATLDFLTEPSFECADDDFRDLVSARAIGLISGRDAVEEYLACGMFPLSASFGFIGITDGETPISKVALPLPEFPLAKL
jgi:hypothetical protein